MWFRFFFLFPSYDLVACYKVRVPELHAHLKSYLQVILYKVLLLSGLDRMCLCVLGRVEVLGDLREHAPQVQWGRAGCKILVSYFLFDCYESSGESPVCPEPTYADERRVL